MPRPVLDVVLGGATYTGGSWSTTVVQDEYGIDACVLSLPRSAVNSTSFTAGTTVSVTYGRNRAFTTNFVGYIHHIEPNRDANTTVAKVICIGAASPQLRDAANRVWPIGATAQGAVRAIGNQLRLSTLTEATAIAAPGGPANESWWRYIVRTAKRCGFTCYSTGTDLRFYSRRIDASGNAVPWFTSLDNRTTRTANIIHAYEVIDSDDASENNIHRKRRAWGVTDEGLTVRFSDVGDLESVGGTTQTLPTLTRDEDFVVHDYATAEVRLTGAKEASRFTKVSDFVLSGDETVRQASTIVLRGLSSQLDGYWYVLNVTHQITTSGYAMKVRAGRDGNGDSAPTNLTTPVAIIDLGRSEPVPPPVPQLRAPAAKASDLVFAPTQAVWAASALVHRTHAPWRAAVRG